MTSEKFVPWIGSELTWHPERFRLDGSSLNVKESAAKTFEGMTGVSDEVKNSMEYCEAVAERFSSLHPNAKEFARLIRDRLDSDPRFVIVDGLEFHLLPADVRDAFVLALCSLVGRPTKTDKVEGKIVWDVTPREYLDHTNTTFSEHSGEAEFHTDSQFFPEPERYFSLWSLRQASDGGGVNGLVDARMITRRLVEAKIGIEAMATLAETDLPFRVPTVFTEQRKDEVAEVLMAPVFAQRPYMRYRKDTLQKGLIAKGMHLEPQISRALQQLESIIGSQDLILKHFLQTGQVLFGNNHEILHNRTSFVDQKRHLLRVRMNERLK